MSVVIAMLLWRGVIDLEMHYHRKSFGAVLLFSGGNDEVPHCLLLFSFLIHLNQFHSSQFTANVRMRNVIVIRLCLCCDKDRKPETTTRYIHSL